MIGNAIKFIPDEGGKIEIGSRCLENEVLFTVADNGPGIAPEDLPHIFDRFWHSARAKKAGTGLGLAIARGMVEAHHGRIWAESK